ncbi:transglycosylase domain-containing protein [Streptomyces sp. WMMC500]|uniref:transglycosylase domain-containing protein n=1 Tax=Streptomyces sp. WMMC500 TaxID=3015154 RepID=UPI00248D0011|nr:transglycosylase domain-containing protein [Streptomyces sp. WMMC500]WBB59126.1 transglycosylase domain-containing protein [Streptomyces sp. WMMC500]
MSHTEMRRPTRSFGPEEEPEDADVPDGAPASPPVLPPPPPPARSAPVRRRGAYRRTWWKVLLGAAMLTVALASGAFAVGYLTVDIPRPNDMATAQSNHYFYADGSKLADKGEVDRESVQLQRVPDHVRMAVLAAEDRAFYSDSAVNPMAMVRAGFHTLTGKGTQSGSTITQQYVKNYYLDQAQTISRKLREAFIAIKLDREVTKDDVLEGYLNTSYFGRNAYGVQAAARAYYDKDVEELTVAEGAFLATLLQAPSTYDVAVYPDNRPAAEARWDYVLDGMVKEGWLAPGVRDSLKFPVPEPSRLDPGLSGQRGYLVEAINSYLIEHRIIDEKTLAAGGFRIVTTLQPGKQDAFVGAVEEQLTYYLDPESNPADSYVRVGGASIDVGSGEVVALYGGTDYTQQYVSNATRRDYQAGSTFKPFVFAAAVQEKAHNWEGRRITPRTMYDGDNDRRVIGRKGKPLRYSPSNQDDVSYGRISVADATNDSVNSVYAQMAQDVGPKKVRRTAVRLGLPSDTPELKDHPSIGLGTATPSALDLAQAYATLAGHGDHGGYRLVDRLSRNGEIFQLPPRRPQPVVSRTAADATTAMLQNVVENGSGEEAQIAERPAAGKTGTGEHDRSAWFAGYTPELATVVGVMGQDPETGAQKSLHGVLGEDRISGGGVPARIWGAYTRNALWDVPVSDFDLEIGHRQRMPSEPPAAPDPLSAPTAFPAVPAPQAPAPAAPAGAAPPVP